MRLSIPNFINPNFIINKFYNIVLEVNIYLKYISALKQMKNNKIIGDTLELRKDYINRLYSVINLPPEFLIEEENKEELNRLEVEYLKHEFKKYNDVFLEYGILDLIKMKTEKICTKDHYAFIIKIKYKWNETNIIWVLYIVFLIGLLIKLYTIFL